MKPIAIAFTFLIALLGAGVACDRNSPIDQAAAELSSFGERTRGGHGAGADPLPAGLITIGAGQHAPQLPSAAVRAEGLALFRQALGRADAGDHDEAGRLFGEAARVLPLLADWAALLAARGHASIGEVSEMDRHLATIREGGAGYWAWQTRYHGFLQRNDTSSALQVAARAAPALQLPTEQADAWHQAAVLRLAQHDSAGALADWKRALHAGATTRGALAAARALHDFPELDPEDRLTIGRVLLAHGGLERGIPLLSEYARAAPPAASAAIHAEAGRALFNARRYADAISHLSVAAPTDPIAALLLARAIYRQGEADRGIERLVEVSRLFPSAPAASDALFLLGDLAHDEGRVTVAREYYRQAVATGIHSASATDAAVRLAGIELLAGTPNGAREGLESFLRDRPRDALSAPALYWLGRSRAELGDAEGALSLFQEVLEHDPISYYGMLAARRLGTSLDLFELGEPPPVSDEVTRVVELEFFRIDLLQELGLRAEAETELLRLQQIVAQEPGVLYSVAEAMARHGRPGASALLGRRIQQERREWDERLLRIVFPFPYRDLVEEAAQLNALDPYAVAGLIRQESLFDPEALSPAGAIGLMQLMPQTASGLARRSGIGNFEAKMLRDPKINLHLGTIYLADQIRRWQGRDTNVFAAYNAGPNRVVRWVDYPEYQDDEIYVERIPLAETRDYVKRVRLNGEIYRRLYQNRAEQK